MMMYLYSFLFVGIICAICQLILDNSRLTPGHLTSVLVIIGAFTEINKLYDTLFDKIGAGVLVPITSFGHLLAQGALKGASIDNPLAIFTDKLTPVSAGITFAIVLSFICALIFNPKD